MAATSRSQLLDDNKLLTLPSGERLALPPNVRVVFEVVSLKYATMVQCCNKLSALPFLIASSTLQATVSRCGMVCFAEATVTQQMAVARYLKLVRLAQ
jgi:dynein heavy chain 1